MAEMGWMGLRLRIMPRWNCPLTQVDELMRTRLQRDQSRICCNHLIWIIDTGNVPPDLPVTDSGMM